MYLQDDDSLLATAEQMLLHVNTTEGRACPVREDVATRVEMIAAAHASLDMPEQAGRSIGLGR
jgi:carnitine 3-dehydrogenase